MVPEAAAPAGESMDRGDGRPEKVKTVKAIVYGNEEGSHTASMDGGVEIVSMKR
jgi:hypothetical protein